MNKSTQHHTSNLACFTILVFLFLGQYVLAQVPANDDCSKSEVLTIGNNGFALATISSSNVDMTNATIQQGENFHSIQKSSNNNVKSVWFKFTIPTARSINLKLNQVGNTIPQSDAGITTYFTSNCLPAVSTVDSSNLTPLDKFGSTSTSCSYPGTYLVQISAKNGVKGKIYIELTLSEPGVLNSYDMMAKAYSFGTISTASKFISHDIGCESIEDQLEYCQALGNEAKTFTQSSWYTFYTPSYIDFLRVNTSWVNNGNKDSRIVYRLYEGDAKTSSLGSLSLVDGCKISTTGDGKYDYLCTIKPNTVYSVQLLFYSYQSGTVKLDVTMLGKAASQAPVPVVGQMASSNKLGVITSNMATTKKLTDYMGCNSRLSLAANTCGDVNPLNGYKNSSGDNLNLATWLTFELDVDASVAITLAHWGHTCNFIYGRLFRKDAGADCSSGPSLSDLEIEFSSDTKFPCLARGKYSLQVLGILSSDPMNCGNALGDQLEITINTVPLPINNYGLAQAGKIDNINNFNAIKYDSLYSSNIGSFDCTDNVLPESNPCSNNYTKALYRRFNIADADADGVNDSMYITLTRLSLSAFGYFDDYKIYSGDANALAVSQNKFSAGQVLSGLNSLYHCMQTPQNNSFCLLPGPHTVATFGFKNNVSDSDKIRMRVYRKIKSRFNNPNTPDTTWGDINTLPIEQKIMAISDTVTCVDNPATIDNLTPCNDFTKLFYRVFTVSKYTVARFSPLNESSHKLRLFTGDCRNGLNTLKYYKDSAGKWGCDTPIRIHYCYPLPPGTYTLVSYLSGKGYNRNDITDENKVTRATNVYAYIYDTPKPPRYDYPYKANTTNYSKKPFDLKAGGLGYQQDISQDYPLDTEYFNCNNNLPYKVHPTTWFCNDRMNRTAYYVFNIKQESYLTLKNTNTTNISYTVYARIYNFDVRKDSSRMATDSALQPCMIADNYIQICKMQAGTYTILFNVSDSMIGDSLMFSAYVSTVPYSRFDHANLAYDFGNIPGDGNFYDRKQGDSTYLKTHAASFDFFNCTTGASANDPGADKYTGIYDPSVSYPIQNNRIRYNTPPNMQNAIRRNLWYTFTVGGAGRIKVYCYEKPDPNRSAGLGKIFKIYKSNINGAIPFTQLQKTGKVDSTIFQGLSEVANNIGSNDSLLPTAGFLFNTCSDTLLTRYYIVVDQAATQVYPNDWVELSVKYDSINSYLPNNDHYINANVINGLKQFKPPYKDSALSNGIFEGFYSSIDCATKASTDQNLCGNQTVWYRFDVGQGKKLRWNYDLVNIDTNSRITLSWNEDIKLYKEIVKGDSTSTGLVEQISYSTANLLGKDWQLTCATSGRYYIMFTGCNHIFLRRYLPRIWLDNDQGDYCSDPIDINISGAGTALGKTDVSCHTSGDSYGEDGSNMGCLYPIDSGYKTTWFKVNMSSTNKMDMSFALANKTTASSTLIRYRILYGTCDAMTPGPCNVSAFTKFTLNCMTTGVYYVQVQSPADARGDVELLVTSVLTAVPNCSPINPDLPVADFEVEKNCNYQPIKFKNHSTAGTIMKYSWDFGYNNLKDTAKNPLVFYPITHKIDSYTVTLKVTNTKNKLDSIISKKVILYPVPTAAFVSNAGCAELAVQFTDSSNYNMINIANRIWDFGDTLTSNAINPVHPYADFGTKNVSLIIISDHGCTDTALQTITINPPPHAAFTSRTVCLGDTIFFNETSSISAGNIITWDWDYGDGIQETITNNNYSSPYHIYNSSGSFLVSLKVTSDSGCSDLLSQLAIVGEYPVPLLIADSPICLKSPANFYDFSTINNDSIMSWLWNFGDGTSSKLKNPTHIFKKEGLYSIGLKVISSIGCSTDTIYIDRVIVHPRPKSNFSLAPDSVSFFTPTITFTNNSVGADTYIWYFGNGDSTTDINPIYDYTDTGRYRVKLISVNTFGCKDSSFGRLFISPDFTFFMPNTFTPNGQGPAINETYGPEGVFKGIAQFNMHIYNRWGQEMFVSHHITQRWDGTYHGKPCQQDLYIYRITYVDYFKQEQNKAGKVYLLR
ncbi:MAG: PKD domain-containing protein [Bacteroidota bacterium]|nr:PKD domain-containing protein [Bacteroidota bacterium]